MSAPAVVVFGATSYLGQYVLDDLLERGYRVFAVTRNPRISAILLHRWESRITVLAADQIASVGKAAAVFNLAYVKSELPHQVMRQNTRLMNNVHEATMQLNSPRLIHVSTQAVFGYEFDEPPMPVAATRRTGGAYIESKAHAESLAVGLNADASYRLDIVRLGNIVGAGSPVWTANLAQRLREGRPVGVIDHDGYSNAAYAPNIASYLGHIADASASSLQEVGRYHHFADLSARRWSEVIARYADSVGVAPILTKAPAPERSPVRPVLARALKSAYGGPIGSIARRSLALVNADNMIDAAMFATNTALSASRGVDPFEVPADRDLLAILSSAYEFRSHVVPEWKPPIGGDDALDVMGRWIVEAGFTLRSDNEDVSAIG